MTVLRNLVKNVIPTSRRKKLRLAFFRFIDPIAFRLWLLWQCARHRQRAVVICRTGALGDVICALPMCVEARKRYPGRLIVFATQADYRSMVILSPDVDEVFGAQSWLWPYALPENFNFLGLVEKMYCPRTSSERSNNGPNCHLMEDLAGSCGVTLADPWPRLNIPPALRDAMPAKYGFAEHLVKGRLIIGINCGQVWPVRMWAAAKWQALLDRIHAEYDAAILQFGFRKGDQDEYDNFRGIQCELRMPMSKDELIALVANCDLMISVDSGPTHISGAVGTPLVGLYGALNPNHFIPRHSPAVGIYSNVPCLFCADASPIGHWQSGCPNDIRCMKELEVEPVFQAVKSMLDKNEKARKPEASK